MILKRKYLKKIIYFLLLIILVFFISSCSVNAQTLNFSPTNICLYTTPGSNTCYNVSDYTYNGVQYSRTNTFNFTRVDPVFRFRFADNQLSGLATANRNINIYMAFQLITGGFEPANPVIFFSNGNNYYYCNTTIANNSGASSNYSVNSKLFNVYCPYIQISTNNNFYMNVSFDEVNGGGSNAYIGISKNIEFSPISDNKQVVDAIQENNQKQQEIINKQNEINNSITDSSVDNDNVSNTFDSLNNMLPTNGSISNLVGLPVQLLTSINNSINGSCSTLPLFTIFGWSFNLPCINLAQYLGTTWIIIDTIMSGMLVFAIGKSLVKIFAQLSSMDDNIIKEAYKND